MTAKQHANRQTIVTVLLASFLVSSMFAVIILESNAQTTWGIGITGFAFVPQNFLIPSGDTVVWQNIDPVIYTLWFVNTSDSSTYLLSDPILPGETWSHTFNDKLRLQYYDLNRLWITGFLTVTWLGDLDGDFDVDQFDFWHFCGAFIDYYTPPYVKDPVCDFDNDCDIDQFDFWTFCGGFIDYYEAM